MIRDISRLRVGDKVHYQPHHSADQWQNGVIKRINPERQPKAVWVVFHCAGNWENYANYTAALTELRDLNLGWRFK